MEQSLHDQIRKLQGKDVSSSKCVIQQMCDFRGIHFNITSTARADNEEREKKIFQRKLQELEQKYSEEMLKKTEEIRQINGE